MSKSDPAIHFAPERRARFRELPLWTVLFVAGVVLAFGFGGGRDRLRAGVSGEPAQDGFDFEGFAREDGASSSARRAQSGGDQFTSNADLRSVASLDRSRTDDGTGTESGLPKADLVGVLNDWMQQRGGSSSTSGPSSTVHVIAVDQVPSETGSYTEGVRHGEWVSRWASGEAKSKGKYEAGLKEGLWSEYSGMGMLISEITYESGERNGLWRAYSPTGEQTGEGEYESNARCGLWTRWYSDGRIKERGTYESGLREGVWEFYDDLGEPTVRAGTYRAGVKIN